MIPRAMTIYVAATPVDLHRSFDGLATLAREQMACDPLRGALFLFFNKARDRVKLLWWDRSGYCLLYKRLHRGCFRIPEVLTPEASSVTIEAAELTKILEGIELPPSKLNARGVAASSVVLPAPTSHSA